MASVSCIFEAIIIIIKNIVEAGILMRIITNSIYKTHIRACRGNLVKHYELEELEEMHQKHKILLNFF